MFEVHACEKVEKQSQKKIKYNNNSKISNVSEKFNVKSISSANKCNGSGDNELNRNVKFEPSIKSVYALNEDLNRAAAVNNASLKSYILDSPIIIMHHLFIGSFGFLVIVVSN